ncbi:MAG: Gfo/Idh/MocA family oxidoreductase [bacterium]
MSKKTGRIVNVGIAGQGRSGYCIHADWLKQVGDRFKIVAVADQLLDRRQDAQRQFGARTYPDYAAMIKAGGFDLFIDALPTPLHTTATIAALRAGYHVVSEKPLAATVKDVDRMAAAACKANRVLAPFQNNRLQPFFDKLQEIIRSGVLGEILAIRSVWSHFARRWDWQTLRRNHGGTLYNTGPHAVDQALALIGWDKQPEVFCKMACRHQFGGDAEDYCALTLHGKGIPTVEIMLSQYLAYPQGDMYSVQGTLGGLTGHATELKWKYYNSKTAPKQKFWKQWSLNRQYPREELPWVEKTWTVDESLKKYSTGYTLQSFSVGSKRFYDNLYDVLVNNGELMITVPQVRKQIAVIEEAHRQNPELRPQR